MDGPPNDYERLTPRQRAFVEAYLGECRYNATKAALAAGYSPKHPRQSAHQVRRSPRVAAVIKRLFWRQLDAISQRHHREMAAALGDGEDENA